MVFMRPIVAGVAAAVKKERFDRNAFRDSIAARTSANVKVGSER
jgi:hypothetical protein